MKIGLAKKTTMKVDEIDHIAQGDAVNKIAYGSGNNEGEGS